MFTLIHKSKNPKFLVITPLRENDTISENTLKIINDTKTEFDWISFSGNNNIPTNTQLGWEHYINEYGDIDYIIKVDNDITANPNFLDSLYETLKNSPNNVAYSYCSFSFINEKTKIYFRADDFNIEKLLRSNYISSVSMIKTKPLKKIGGFVRDNKYVRLLDYALWLKFLSNDYIGIADKNTYFEAELNRNSISARSQEDYINKMKLVYNDFVLPYKKAKKLVTY